MTFLNLRKFKIIIAVILALIIARLGISYLIILLAIGFIFGFFSSKLEAIITGILYALLSYAASYPAGLFLADYMPTTNVTIETSATTVGIDVMMGALIPSLVALILCGITAIIGSEIAKLIHKDKFNSNNKKEKTKRKEEHHYNVIDNFKNNKKQKKIDKQHKKELIYQTPIQKAKMKKQK